MRRPKSIYSVVVPTRQENVELKPHFEGREIIKMPSEIEGTVSNSMSIPLRQEVKRRKSSKPIPLPQNKKLEEEVETNDYLTRMYNESTWQMYYRIQNARRNRLKLSSKPTWRCKFHSKKDNMYKKVAAYMQKTALHNNPGVFVNMHQPIVIIALGSSISNFQRHLLICHQLYHTIRNYILCAQ